MNQNGITVIGITGQTGAGKSVVSSYLKQKGFHAIDADLVSRKVVEHGKPALRELVSFFGEDILNSYGTLNRSVLAKLAFSNIESKKALESIIFPYIEAEIVSQIEAVREQGGRAVFLDAPTLYESGIDHVCEAVIAVISPRSTRLDRILKRDSITHEQAEQRLDAQNEDEFYTSRADFIINNQGSLKTAEKQVDEILKRLNI